MKCPECGGDPNGQEFVRTGQCSAGSVEGYTCTNVFHKGFRYEDRIQGDSLQNYAISVSAALSREFGERFPEDKPHITALIEQTERILRRFD